ncbi:MAG: hypothetical protein H0T11_07810, partial [Chthoniobacterales bacterium]|nr:hypothetical protein [Chthoniobacterales bacterium]
WSQSYETIYQGVREQLLSRDESRVPPQPNFWQERVQLYHALRFARLCAALRHREPDAHAGYSILIFNLTDAEVANAVEGPPVELFPQLQVDGR